MPKIFIGYRRDDARGNAGRLYDRLTAHYGKRRVFRDVDTIASGADFVAAIRASLSECATMLVVIGPDWVGITDKDGVRRLEAPEDQVATEVRLGLERDDLQLIPVLVSGARMPEAEELPGPLRDLANRNAVGIREDRFDADVDHLIERIGGRGTMRAWARAHKARAAFVAAGAAAAIIALALALRAGGPAQLEGDFNVAVAEFAVTGETAEPNQGEALAEAVYAGVTDVLQAFEQSGDFTNLAVAEPAEIGTVDGESAAVRAIAAEELAAEVRADVILYGTLESGSSVARFTPEFYLSARNLRNAEELAGAYSLGLLTIPTSDPVAVNREITAVLDQLSAALAELAIGLSYYATTDYETSQLHLEAAETEWPQPAGAGISTGKEVVLHMLGNVAGKQGSLDEARQWYLEALTLDAEQVRSMFGLAEVDFLQARGADCGVPDREMTDIAAVEDALRRFQEIAVTEAPPLSAIDMRAEVKAGSAYLCLALADEGRRADALAGARSALEAAAARYDGSDERIRDLSAEAHQSLALYWILQGDVEAALAEYQVAIDHSLDEARKAFFHSARGDLYACSLGDDDRSSEEYARAAALISPPPPRQEC